MLIFWSVVDKWLVLCLILRRKLDSLRRKIRRNTN